MFRVFFPSQSEIPKPVEEDAMQMIKCPGCEKSFDVESGKKCSHCNHTLSDDETLAAITAAEAEVEWKRLEEALPKKLKAEAKAKAEAEAKKKAEDAAKAKAEAEAKKKAEDAAEAKAESESGAQFPGLTALIVLIGAIGFVISLGFYMAS